MALCFCHTCDRAIDSNGIARHRAMHRDRKENCTITFSSGKTYEYEYEEKNSEGIHEKSK